MKQYTDCPHCGKELEVTTKGKCTANVRPAPKFRSKEEKKAFYAWTEEHGLKFAKGSDDEYPLIRQFREMQASG